MLIFGSMLCSERKAPGVQLMFWTMLHYSIGTTRWGNVPFFSKLCVHILTLLFLYPRSVIYHDLVQTKYVSLRTHFQHVVVSCCCMVYVATFCDPVDVGKFFAVNFFMVKYRKPLTYCKK
jgi:hypothetical protein